MIAEFSILPVGTGVSLSKHIAKALDIVDRSGLKYQFTPMGTILEGTYEEIMSTIKECHNALTRECERVLTTIRIDDRKGSREEMKHKVEAVESLLGRKLHK